MPAPPAIVISATFTSEPIAEALGFWMRELGYPLELHFAPYNQVFQQLLDPGSDLCRNREGVNVLLIRPSDWGSGAANLDQFINAVRSSPARCPLLIAICPPTADGVAKTLRTALPDAYILDHNEQQALYPVDHPYDPDADALGRVPYTPLFFAALGTLLARKIHALRTPPYKVAALDCDDTLWKGVCGEDGPAGVILDQPRRQLQQFLLKQREAGMLLCLASKNNESDVLATFAAHPEFPLRPELCAAWKIDWQSKAANLATLAADLNLGLDSFLFLDDNPKECSEVEAACPQVVALPLPADESQIPAFLDHVWAFDRLRVTAEDAARNHLYKQEAQRAQAARGASTLEEFIASLALKVRIEPVTADRLPRVAQLTQRTNQMNFSTLRRNEGDLRALLESGAQILTVDVDDRFGSYGLTGVAILKAEAQTLVIDTFLLSCRVLGRGVEHALLAHIGQLAQQAGLEYVEARFTPTARNKPAQLFLESIAPTHQWNAAALAVLQYKSNAPAPVTAAAPVEKSTRQRINYTRIATDLRTPQQLLYAIAQSKQSSRRVTAEPRTSLERQLCEIWAATLNLSAIGPDENFFDLGGHSLLAVQLLARIRRELDVEVSLETVYSGDFTVAELARAIEWKELERAGVDEYHDLIAEIEKLTEEEVQALLAQEGAAFA